jgi:hypothetical protein
MRYKTEVLTHQAGLSEKVSAGNGIKEAGGLRELESNRKYPAR